MYRDSADVDASERLFHDLDKSIQSLDARVRNASNHGAAVVLFEAEATIDYLRAILHGHCKTRIETEAGMVAKRETASTMIDRSTRCLIVPYFEYAPAPMPDPSPAPPTKP